MFGVEGSVLSKIKFKYSKIIIFGICGNFCLILFWVLCNIVEWGNYTPVEEKGGSKIKKVAIIAGIIELLLLLCLAFSYWKVILERKLSRLNKRRGNKNEDENEDEKEDEKEDPILRGRKKRKKRDEDEEEEEEEEEEEDFSPKRRNFFDQRESNKGKSTIRRDEEEREP